MAVGDFILNGVLDYTGTEDLFNPETYRVAVPFVLGASPLTITLEITVTSGSFLLGSLSGDADSFPAGIDLTSQTGSIDFEIQFAGGVLFVTVAGSPMTPFVPESGAMPMSWDMNAVGGASVPDHSVWQGGSPTAGVELTEFDYGFIGEYPASADFWQDFVLSAEVTGSESLEKDIELAVPADPGTPPLGGTDPVPPTPPKPAYCSTVISVVTNYRLIPVGIDEDGNRVYIRVPDGTTTVRTRTCYPATPGIPGTPGTPGTPARPGSAGSPADFHAGWNAGARSIERLLGNGMYQFSVFESVQGIVTGFNDIDSDTTYNEIDHALCFMGGLVQVMEKGHLVSTTHTWNDADVFSIVRLGTGVTYWQNTTLLYRSTLASNRPVFADASMYFGGDAIIDPVLTDDVDVALAGTDATLAGDLPEITGYLSDTGDGVMLGQFGNPVAVFDTDHMFAHLSGLSGSFGDNAVYAVMSGTFALTGGFTGNQLAPQAGEMQAFLDPISGFYLGLVGTIGSVEGALTQLSGFMTNVGFATMAGVLDNPDFTMYEPVELAPQPLECEATATCALLYTRVLKANAVVQPTATCQLSVTKRLRGSAAAVASATAALGVTRQLAASVAAQASASARLEVSRTLKAQANAVATSTAELLITRVLKGNAVVRATASAQLLVSRPVVPIETEITVTPEHVAEVSGDTVNHVEFAHSKEVSIP